MTLSKHFNFVHSNQLEELKQWSTTDAVEFSMISYVTITIEYGGSF